MNIQAGLKPAEFTDRQVVVFFSAAFGASPPQISESRQLMITYMKERQNYYLVNSYLLRAAAGQNVHKEPLTQFGSEGILESDWLQGVSTVINLHVRNFVCLSLVLLAEMSQ